MLLIFTKKQTPRITYIFKQVCWNILGIKVKFTSKIEEFIAHDGMKISYGKQRMGNEFFIQQVDLLLDQGVSSVEINMDKWEDTPCFFRVSDSDLPFDIFSASFYLLSRYEEYQPYVKNKNGRYPVEESLAYRKDFLDLPVVDIWAEKFKKILKDRFPDEVFQKKTFENKILIAVSQAYLYRKKGVVRTLGASVRDLFNLRLRSIVERFNVLVFNKKDPYDVYADLVDFYKKNQIDLYFMFQLSNYSIVNKNIGYHKKKYRSLIKSMADYFTVGLLLGNEALRDFEVLKTEKKRFESIVNSPLKYVLNDRFDLNLPEAYNNFDKIEIQRDFSMGYMDGIGFRAGTSIPFLFYDLNLERISPLLLQPCVFNSVIFRELGLLETNKRLKKVKNEVKKVSGSLGLVFEISHFSTLNNRTKLLDLIKMLHEHE